MRWKNDERIWNNLCSAWHNNRIVNFNSSENVKGEKMAREIIVEFPSPLTDKEKKMIYGYKGEVVRCKDCKYHKRVDWGMGDCKYPNGFKWIAYDNDFCSRGERKDKLTDGNNAGL